VNLSDPLLMLEREVLKVKLQHSELAGAWPEIEANAFTYAPYAQLRAQIDSLPALSVQDLIERTEDQAVRNLITELIVEPIRTDGQMSEKYAQSVIARLREVALGRSIAEIKSTLQRINPVEEEARYTQIFTELVGQEALRRAQRDLALAEE